MTDIVSIKTLGDRADFFAKQSLSSATKRAYQTDWESFLQFCSMHDLDFLPATPETVCLYLPHLADSGLSVATINRRCTSITAIHEAAGELSPVKDARVHRVLSGIKRVVPPNRHAPKALLWEDLQKIVAECGSMMIGIRDAALLAFGWATALRRSELVSLDVGDLEFSKRGVIVSIRRSKTDQEGSGSKIAVPLSTTGFCPTSIVKRWLERIQIQPLPPDTPVFRHIGVKGKNRWWWEPGGRLSDRMVPIILKHYCRLAGFNPDLYSAHSLRRGLATEAGSRGVPERIISRHTRHRSLSVLRQYIEDGTIWDENPLSAIYTPRSAPLTRLEE